MNETHYSAISGAVTGLVLWLLETYLFKGGVPSAVSAAVLVIVPGATTGIASWWTKQSFAAKLATLATPEAEHIAGRREIIAKARLLGDMSMIPAGWNPDGTLKATVPASKVSGTGT